MFSEWEKVSVSDCGVFFGPETQKTKTGCGAGLFLQNIKACNPGFTLKVMILLVGLIGLDPSSRIANTPEKCLVFWFWWGFVLVYLFLNVWDFSLLFKPPEELPLGCHGEGGGFMLRFSWAVAQPQGSPWAGDPEQA